MNDQEMRKDCPMRGSLGNCSPVGGFCMDAVSDEICEAVHNAYNHGFCNALRTLKEQEAVEPFHRCIDKAFSLIEDSHFDYCPYCGKPITWEGR